MRWERDRAWASTGHEIGPLVRVVLRDEHGILVIEGAGGRYVQLHGMDGEGCHVEADSGEFTSPLTSAQHRRLVELGWSGPDEAAERPGPANYWTERDGPFDVYALVLLLLSTLVEVYGSGPDDIRTEVARCGCADLDEPG